MRQFTEDDRKFKELILYISRKCEAHPDYGSTHLNKILFFADFLAYAKFGQPITGAEYMKERRGPVPRAIRRGANNPVRQLMRDGSIEIKKTPLPRNMMRVTPIARRDPDLSVFTNEEIELVKSVIETYGPWRAGTISKWTHQLPGWHIVPLHGTIPYETIFVSPNQEQSEHVVRRGQELARKYGWLAEK